jgi:transposase InsO family protein
LVSIRVTNNPTAEWIAGQVTDAFPWDEAPRHLIRDRDGAFGPAYTRRIRAMGIRDHPTAPRSPWQNGHVERLIGSIRRESLDHLIVFGEAHLRGVLKAYALYYNELPAREIFSRASGTTSVQLYVEHQDEGRARPPS